MQASSSRLQHEDVLEHARNAIRPGGWMCEWNIAAFNKPTLCKTMLASWSAYLKHILNHCQEYRHGNKIHSYVCRLPRCTIPSGLSISSHKELVNHLRNSHLNRSSLNCPVIGCHSMSFRAPGVLQAHYEEVHSALLGQTASAAFLPSWLPCRPPLEDLERIPTHVIPGSILVEPVKATWRTRPSTPRRLSNGKAKYASPKKPSKMDAPHNPDSKPRNEDDSQDHEEIIFDDLPQQLNDSKSYFRNPQYDCVIRKEGPFFDVSRPQPLLDAGVYGYRVLPETILYKAWVLENKELLDQEDEDEDEETAKEVEAKIERIEPSAPSSSSL